MSTEMQFRRSITEAPISQSAASRHPATQEYVALCEQMRFGEIEKLRIQDGLPVVAEIAIRKVKFGG